jgi:Spy/CpxP family protein refolding chaperone
MKRFMLANVIWPIGLLIVTAGSTATAAEPAPRVCEGQNETDSSADTPNQGSPEAAQKREVFGPVALIAAGLSKTCLNDEQRRAAEQLGEQVSEKEKVVADARHAFRSALVDQLNSGRIDEGALKDEIDAVVKARAEASPVLRKAIEDLHGILDPGQRAALADAIEAHMKEVSEASGGWLDAFARDLGLSDDQKSRIRDVLAKAKPELEEEHASAAAAFDAFKKDDFSMEKISPVARVGERTRARAERMVVRAREIMAILTPEQRADLAKKIESAAREQVGTSQQGDQVQQSIVARRTSYRAGSVGGWGGGVSASRTTVRTGYAAGYPLVGGYGPGVW